MHVYIYDEYVNKKKYDNILARVETRITDLGLNGKIIRLGVMKNINEAIDSEMKRGAKTIVAVGDDGTVNKIINAMIKAETRSQLSAEIPFGIIPIGKENNKIADCLGIGEAEEAGDVLSARRIEKLDIAQAGNNYFLSQAKIESRGTTLEIGKDYSIEIMETGEINIINLSTFLNLPENANSNPQDGVLELYIKTKGSRTLTKFNPGENQSLFSLKNLTIINNQSSITIDSAVKISTPAEISVTKKLNIIVGKERKF
jgi:hypothetical protein